MNRDEIDQLLADELGGELAPSRRQRLDELLANEPDLALELSGLRRALVAMRSLDVPGDLGPATARRSGAEPDTARRRQRLAVMRYAAVIVLSFLVGFGTRGPWPGGPEHDPTGGGSTLADATGQPVSDWELRFADVYQDHPSRSSLARSLIAVAQLTRPQGSQEE